MRRRNLAAFAALLPLMACGIVTTNTVNGVTTFSINMAKFNAYVQAIDNGATALLNNTLIAGALGTRLTMIVVELLASIASASAAITTQANGAATLTFDATSVPAALTSLQKNASSLFDYFKTAMASVGGTIGSNVSTIYSALQTVISLVMALTAGIGAKAAVAPTMPEAQALSILLNPKLKG